MINIFPSMPDWHGCLCPLKSVNWNAVRSRPWWGRGACRASLRLYLTVLAVILWLCKPTVSSAFRVAGLRRSRWRRSRMGGSWAGVVTRGLWFWGRLDVLPTSLKQCWRQFMVEKLTLNYRSTALVDIPAVSMPIARSLKTWDICGIMLYDKTAHFSGLLLFSAQGAPVLLHIPQLSGGWIILAKEKCSLTGM